MTSYKSSCGLSAILGLLALAYTLPATSQSINTYIIEATSSDQAASRVRDAGGQVLTSLPLIDGVGARLDAAGLAALERRGGVRVFRNRALEVESNKKSSGGYSSATSTSKSTGSGSGTSAPATTSSNSGTTPGSTSSGTSLTDALRDLVDDYSDDVALTSGTSPQVFSFLYDPNYAALVSADLLHTAGTTGQGVTIAMLDSGLWQNPLDAWSGRVLASVDFVGSANGSALVGDASGHGTHVTSIAASGRRNIAGDYYGIAPKANVVVARAFDASGAASYLDVIKALNWIVANRKTYNIRVLNLSFGAPPVSFYWDDPLNQAVMKAWKAGIVVITSAGNAGPSPMTIGVPGNVPYVITAGAFTDNFTPYDGTDDKLASFSSTGPTFEGFVKPEVVAPGGHIVASMPADAFLVSLFGAKMSQYQSLFTMSGTSQAAAVTSGVVALMLQAQPSLTPDEVKCKLIAAARPAVNAGGKLAYSVFQQGAGLINAVAAVSSSATGCANAGLDVTKDLAGTAHFGGPANQDAGGNYYVMDMNGSSWGTPLGADGYTWSRAYSGGVGYTWAEGYVWSKGYVWSRGYTWSKGYVWSKGSAWSQGYVWSKTLDWVSGQFTTEGLTLPMSVDPWVSPE